MADNCVQGILLGITNEYEEVEERWRAPRHVSNISFIDKLGARAGAPQVMMYDGKKQVGWWTFCGTAGAGWNCDAIETYMCFGRNHDYGTRF